jgi:hypothetical protein
MGIFIPSLAKKSIKQRLILNSKLLKLNGNPSLNIALFSIIHDWQKKYNANLQKATVISTGILLQKDELSTISYCLHVMSENCNPLNLLLK